MKEEIKENINNPEKLERLYHEDRNSFKSAFEEIFPEIENSEMARFWKTRLDFDKTPEKTKKLPGSDILTMVVICLFAGFLIKIPDLLNLNLATFFFYQKNAGIIVFLALTIFAIWTGRIFEQKKLLIIAIAFLIPVIYINLLPSVKNSDSINLAYIHLPLLMWGIYAFVFIDFDLKDKRKITDYIRYNGDLAIQLALIAIAGGITIGLFKAIGINIEKFYMNNVVVIGLVSAPVVATFIIKNYNTLTNKLAPLIASIFSPLVLLTLMIYLIAMAFSGKDPYNDRNFLLIFNVMLAGVMGIIVFSVSETSINGRQKFNEIVLFILSIITLIIDLVALSAIFYRMNQYGISPNRLAILGSNILIFGNLFLIMIDLYKICFKRSEIQKVELTISKYIPVYLFWTMIVVFGFPLIFGMK
jgi:hypothetical protein